MKMTRGTIMNWWLFGTGVLLIIDPINRIAYAPILEQHSGSVAGLMVLGRDVPYGVVLAAVVAIYSFRIRSDKPTIGIIIAGISFFFVQHFLLFCYVFLLACFGLWRPRDFEELSFAAGGLSILLSAVWRPLKTKETPPQPTVAPEE